MTSGFIFLYIIFKIIHSQICYYQNHLLQQRMIKLKSLQLLFKESSLLETIITMNAKVQVIVNNKDKYISQDAVIENKLARWKANALPDIILSEFVGNVKLEFVFFRRDEEMGKARSFLVMGRNRKDCLDVVDPSFHVIGKFLYEAVWLSGLPQNIYNYQPQMFAKQIMNSYANQKPPPNSAYSMKGSNAPQYGNTVPQYGNTAPQYGNTVPQYGNYYGVNNGNGNGYLNPSSNPYYKNQQIQQQQPKSNKDAKKKSSGLFSSFCCFGSHASKPANTKKLDFAFLPISYTEEDLEYAPSSDLEPFQMQYYSRRFGEKYS